MFHNHLKSSTKLKIIRKNLINIDQKKVHLNVLLLILAHLDSDEQEQGSSNKEMQGELYNNHYKYLILTDLFENRTILCFLVVILLIQVIVAMRIYQSPHISY